MTEIADKPFTQYENLNILDELRIQGVLVTPSSGSFQVAEVTENYTVDVLDDGVAGNGTFSIMLYSSSLADQYVTIKSVAGGGTLTVLPEIGDTIESISSQTVTAGQSLTLMPVAAGWVIV